MKKSTKVISIVIFIIIILCLSKFIILKLQKDRCWELFNYGMKYEGFYFTVEQHQRCLDLDIYLPGKVI